MTSPLFCFRLALGLFIAGLVLSGVTAFPLLTEMNFAAKVLGLENAAPGEGRGGLIDWILETRAGLADTNGKYPWIAYGTDWLAFGHFVIALFFIAAWLKPQDSRSTLTIGLIACAGVVLHAQTAGAIRGIPLFHRLIDSGFGLIGALPLVYCLRLLPRLSD